MMTTENETEVKPKQKPSRKTPQKPKQELPKIVSVSISRVPNSNLWTCLTITTQGDKVIDVQSTQPNFKQIVIDQAKVAFVKLFD